MPDDKTSKGGKPPIDPAKIRPIPYDDDEDDDPPVKMPAMPAPMM